MFTDPDKQSHLKSFYNFLQILKLFFLQHKKEVEEMVCEAWLWRWVLFASMFPLSLSLVFRDLANLSQLK